MVYALQQIRNSNYYNEDARKFIVDRVNVLLSKTIKQSHLIMNLPMDAPEFLDCLKGRFIESKSEEQQQLGKVLKLFIHCYCFIVHVNKDEESKKKEAQERIAKALGIAVHNSNFVFENNFTMREVRDVSPGKLMVCCHFTLQLLQDDDDISNTSGNGKRSKMEL